MIDAIYRVRRALNGLLAAWMALLGLGVSVTHCHAAGSCPHTHGMGWLGLPDESDDDSQPGLPHRHLLIFGVELPSESAPDKLPTDGTVRAAVEADCPDPLSMDWPVAISTDAIALEQAEPVSSIRRPFDRSSSTNLCLLALRLTSGVLRN